MDHHPHFPPQFASAQKASMDLMFNVARTALASFERLASLNLNTARMLLDTAGTRANARLAMKDPVDVLSHQAALTAPFVEQTLAYSLAVRDITKNTLESVNQAWDLRHAEAHKNIHDALDAAVKTAPAGTDVAILAIRSALTTANHAYQSINDAARQLSDLTEANVAAAAKAAVNSESAPVAKARKAA
jgi:hypothetical protein